jgi:hypothetical protein
MPGFLFSTHIVGLAGAITAPDDELIPAQAVSALTKAGGYSSAREDSYRLSEVVSHEGVRSEAIGTYNRETGIPQTVATAAVLRLNILDVLLVESCRARIASVHPTGQEPRITPLGSMFEGLRIAGRSIELESKVDLYSKIETLSSLREHYQGDASFRERFQYEAFVGREKDLPDNVLGYFPWAGHSGRGELPEDRGTTILPLFTVMNPSEPGFEVYGNVISVENFGRIQLGQLAITPNTRSLTMMQVDLGSPVRGQIVICSGETGGVSLGDGGRGYLAPPIRVCEGGHRSVSSDRTACWCGKPFRR